MPRHRPSNQAATSSRRVEVAGALLNLGSGASDRRDLAKTEDYFTRALATAEKAAPGSIDVARCLDNLAGLWWRRGDMPKAEEFASRAMETTRQRAPGSVDLAKSLNKHGRPRQDRQNGVERLPLHQMFLLAAHQRRERQHVQRAVGNDQPPRLRRLSAIYRDFPSHLFHDGQGPLVIVLGARQIAAGGMRR